MLAFGVFSEDVYFDVEGGAGGEGVEVRGGVGVRDDGDLDEVAGDGGDGEADAFDGDGALGDDVSGEGVGGMLSEGPSSAIVARRGVPVGSV